MGTKGGVLTIITRDERFDKVFTASDYLRKRLDAIRAQRKEQKQKNIQPTFHDIERSHVLYVRGVYQPFVAVASEYTQVKSSGDGTASLGISGGSIQFAFPIFGHFTSDMALNIKISPIGSQNADPATAPRYRYCAYPGMRIQKKVEFMSDQTVIDDYNTDDIVAWSKFFIGSDQRSGFERCMGQQELKEAQYYNNNGFTGSLPYRDGAQTWKYFHDTQEFWIPLLFDFCGDASRALLNDLIPNTQRVVAFDMAGLGDIIQAIDPAGAAIPLPFSKVTIQASLYVNNLYVNPEIHQIFASRIGIHLMRVHRQQKVAIDAFKGQVLLSQIKYPVEYVMTGIRSKDNANNFDQWWLMGAPKTRTPANELAVPAVIWNAGLGIHQMVVRVATETSTLEPLAESIGVTAQGVTIFPEMPLVFYNGYLSNRYYEKTRVMAPVDSSALLIPFCLYPGNHNPSGYFNLSTAREMYITYSASQISSQRPAEMVISASVLNFIVRKGDKVALRYPL